MKIFAISSSHGQEVTGSISKILALGSSSMTSTFQRIEFGSMTNPESSFTQSGVLTNPISVPAGTYIEGPIGREKGRTRGFLIYL